MESKFKNTPEAEDKELEEAERLEDETAFDGEFQDDEKHESEFVRNTRRAAENAKHLGFNSEIFQALGLRERTILSFLNIQEDINTITETKETPGQQDNSEQQDDSEKQSSDLIFMDNGVQFEDSVLPYSEQIQRQIHESYLEQNLRSPDFGKKLLSENQVWQEQLIEEEKKKLIPKVTTLFQNIMHSRYANPGDLSKNKGLEESEFLELLQLEDQSSSEKITTDFLEAAGIKFDLDRSLEWHLENAKYFETAHTSVVSEKEYSTALESAQHQTRKLRAIKRAYEAFIDKVTKPAYRPFKKSIVNPYQFGLNYYADKESGIFRDKRRYRVDLNDRYKPPKTSLNEAIDSIALFCENNKLEIKFGDINLEAQQKITPEQVEDFIENNTSALNDYCNVHLYNYRKSRKELDKYVASITIRDSFHNNDSFREAIEQNPYYEQKLREIFHEARYLEIIRIIYGNTSAEYQKRLNEGQSNNEQYNIIQNEYNAILKIAQDSKVPLKGESTRLEDAQKTLQEEYGIKENISDDAVDIILKHHREFSSELNQGIVKLGDFKKLQKKYLDQKKAKETLEERIAGAYEELDNPSETKDEYYKKLEVLGKLSSCITKIKQHVRKDFFVKQQGSKEKLDVIRHTLDLPANLGTLNLPEKNELVSQLRELLVAHNITDNPKQYTRELVENEKRACELKIKLASNCAMKTERVRITQRKRNRQFSEAEEEYDQLLLPTEAAKKWANSYANRKVLNDKVAAIAYDLGYNGKATSILFTPGYMICFSQDNLSEILPIDPKTFADSDNPDIRALAPLADKPPFRSEDEIVAARKFLNHMLETEILKNEAVGSNALEKRILDLQERFHIEFPQNGIEYSTGRLEPQPTKAELNGLETIYPFFGKFITKAETSTGFSYGGEKLTETLQKIQKDFICGEGTKGRSLIFQDDTTGRSIRLSTLADLLRAKNIPSAKALELLAYDAAICDMTGMSQNEVSEYQRLAQDRLPADPRTFMLLYQKTITNPLELRACATKLSYCREFAKYCAGSASTPELKAFFDERAKKAKHPYSEI